VSLEQATPSESVHISAVQRTMWVGVISGTERNGGTHCDWPERNPNPNPMTNPNPNPTPGVLKVFESRSIFSLPPTLRGPQDY